jgi:hypothetical protein
MHELIFSFTALLQLSHDFACNCVSLPVGDTAVSFECMTCLAFEEESIWITRTIEVLDNFIIAKFLCSGIACSLLVTIP